MTTLDTGADWVSAPSDYTALFIQYYPYVVSLVRSLGIEDSRKEDVASDILMRVMERDVLSMFNPALVFEYGGETRPAKFKSFLTKIVMMYVRGHWDRQQRRTNRELLLCDRPIGDGHNIAWVDVFGGVDRAAEDDVLDTVEGQELVAEIRCYLRHVPRRSPYDGCDLVAFFDEVVNQIRESGCVMIADLQERFGIGSTATHAWMWWLRENVCDALGMPLPAKRARTLHPPEVST